MASILNTNWCNKIQEKIKQNPSPEDDRLITAAPELLEALELIACCDETGYIDGHGFIDVQELAKKAITKAKG